MRVGMPDGYDSMPSVKIEVLFAMLIPDITAFTTLNVNVEEWIYVEWFHDESADGGRWTAEGERCMTVCRLPSTVRRQNTVAFSCNPVVSGRSNIKFIFCTACPDAPFNKLSIKMMIKIYLLFFVRINYIPYKH